MLDQDEVPSVDEFLAAKGMGVDEAYDYIVDRTSECRKANYYPDYFYENKIPLMDSELRIDARRPTKLKRFNTATPLGAENQAPVRYSSSMLREWNSGFTSPPLKPRKQRVKNQDKVRSIEGHLMKKTVGYGGMNSRWEQRYVVVSDECLKYTKSKDVSRSAAKWRVYPFTSRVTNACKIAQDGVTLIVDGRTFGYPRVLELRATSAADAEIWCDKLNQAARSLLPLQCGKRQGLRAGKH